MKTVLMVLILALAFQLTALMDFTQMNNISIENGTYSYAEMKSVQGEDCIIVYSQDMNNIYLTICDTDGNTLDTMSLAMTDSTSNRKMCYFEFEDEPYLVVTRIVKDDRIYNGNNWTEPIHFVCEILSLTGNESIDEHIVDTTASEYHHDSSCTVMRNCSGSTTKCVTCYDDVNPCTLYVSFRQTYSQQSYYDELSYSDYGDISIMSQVHFNNSNDISYSFVDDIGLDIISGIAEGYPAICVGRHASKNVYNDYRETSISVDNYIYANNNIVSRDLYIYGSHMSAYNSDRYLLLSDNYPGDANSLVFLSVEYDWDSDSLDYIFSGCSMSGALIWSTDETNLIESDFLTGTSASCCFHDVNNTPLTVYFAPSTNNYEVRDMTNGDITDSGEAPFTPVNIERIEDETLVYLAPTNEGVEVWHGTYTVGIDDPTDSPALELTAGNYPNPFNPTTTISYSLPSSGMVEVSVFNTRGQLVRTLVHEKMDTGNFEVVWHGDDENGKPVSSGIYLYRVQADNRTITGKMLMLK